MDDPSYETQQLNAMIAMMLDYDRHPEDDYPLPKDVHPT